MAKASDSTTNQPDNPKPSDSSQTPGRTPVLNTDGFKTSGLTDKKKGIEVKAIDSYQVQPTDQMTPALAQEKARTEAIKQLLNSLQPGCQIPEGANFQGLRLSERDLQRSRFEGALLKNTRLRNCLLQGAVFKSCNLSGADLRWADLSGALFDRCQLNGADLRGCNLTQARIVDCDLFAANLDNSILDEAIIDHCAMAAPSFHNSSCRGLRLSNSQVTQGFFDSATLTGAQIHHMLFRDCTLTNARFDQTRLDNCCFRACDSTGKGPVFSECRISHMTMMDCDLEDTQLINTRIAHSRIERINMTAALLEGTHFDHVAFDHGTLKDCYSLEKAPRFDQCTFTGLVLDSSEFSRAHFNKSTFIGARITDCDFGFWSLCRTGIDGSTVVESCYGNPETPV